MIFTRLFFPLYGPYLTGKSDKKYNPKFTISIPGVVLQKVKQSKHIIFIHYKKLFSWFVWCNMSKYINTDWPAVCNFKSKISKRNLTRIDLCLLIIYKKKFATLIKTSVIEWRLTSIQSKFFLVHVTNYTLIKMYVNTFENC